MAWHFNKTLFATALAGLASSVFCTNALAHYEPPINADVGYIQLSDLPADASSINPIRLEIIRETATTLGARGALAWQSVQINRQLEKEATYLDHIFDFNRLLINNDVLPPVLEEANDHLNLNSHDSIRLASKIYKIQAPAKFVTTAPNWRNYLWMNYKKPLLPDKSLLPRTQAEANIWNMYLKDGWHEGLAQANAIFSINVNRLRRDFTGMLLYRKLLAQHMVSEPYVAQANLGVTGDANELRIDDRIKRITAPAQLQTNEKRWTPILTKNKK